jgi:hypothetical protein
MLPPGQQGGNISQLLQGPGGNILPFNPRG